jgi:hypothetical protein
VTDDRAALNGDWTADSSSSDITYILGTDTADSGDATFTDDGGGPDDRRRHRGGLLHGG